MNVIDVVHAAEDGEGRETKRLFDGPGLMLTQLTLRHGTSLAEHASPDPLLIDCVTGVGVLRAGGEEVPLRAGRRVVLDAGEPHSVVAGDLLTLILTRFTRTAGASVHSHGGSP